jgi:hypothetical protein
MKTRSIVLCGAAVIACLFALNAAYGSRLWQPQAPARPTAPPGVEVPPDIAAFLRTLGNAYGSPDYAELPRHLARDFLYQGMNGDAFIEHLKQHQKYLGKLDIVPISIKTEGEAVRIVAYAVSPRGVVAPSMQLLPLNIGATLIRQDGAWKLRGNQRNEEAALYRQLASVTADFTPSDMEAYKRLVPAGYSVPEQPFVRISINSWLDMEPPQTPYRLVNLCILVRKNEENHWYIVAMPETDWVAVKAGNAVGFPKFVTDIDIDRSVFNAWKVQVRDRGQALMRASFEADPEARSSFVRKVDAWLLVDQEKQEIRATMTPLGDPQDFAQKFGWMTVDTIASPWKELVAPGSRAAATTMDLTMGLKLNMMPLLPH